MPAPRSTPAKALAAALGLAIALMPATFGTAAAKTPPKQGTVKGCSLKKKAKCKKAKLTKVKVGKVNLSGANLAGATITGATFAGTNLTGVNLTGARISNTTFTGVAVTNLDLSKARLSNVRFVRAVSSGVGAASQAREDACSATTDPGFFFNKPWTWFECTGGGIDVSGSTLVNVVFERSNIPGSKMVGTTFTSSGPGGPGFFFLNSRVDKSDFSRSTGAALEGDIDGGPTQMTVIGSVFDGARKVSLAEVEARNASFVGTQFGPPQALYRTDTTGARGLNGTISVGLLAGQSLGAGTVKSVIIREDGYFSPGIRCDALPCTYDAAAIGAPGKVIVGSTSPVEVTLAGWQCGAAEPVGVPATSWTTTCTVTGISGSEARGTVGAASTPAETRVVAVDARDGYTLQPYALSSMRIDRVSAAGAVLGTWTCFGESRCAQSVARGTRVRITMTNATGQLVGWCSATAAFFTGSAPPNSSYTCPDVEVNDDLTATVQVS